MSVPNIQPTNAYNNPPPQIAGYNNMNSNYNMAPNNMHSNNQNQNYPPNNSIIIEEDHPYSSATRQLPDPAPVPAPVPAPAPVPINQYNQIPQTVDVTPIQPHPIPEPVEPIISVPVQPLNQPYEQPIVPVQPVQPVIVQTNQNVPPVIVHEEGCCACCGKCCDRDTKDCCGKFCLCLAAFFTCCFMFLASGSKKGGRSSHSSRTSHTTHTTHSRPAARGKKGRR